MSFRVLTVVVLGHPTLKGDDLFGRLPAEVLSIFEAHGASFQGKAKGVSAVFDSPSAAVRACTAAASVLGANQETAGISFAINTGEIDLDSDSGGRTLEITQHISRVVAAGTINFAEATYLSMNKESSPSTYVGQHVFRGIPEAITIHTVISDQQV
jgi:class 3 adenylate cyclase